MKKVCAECGAACLPDAGHVCDSCGQRILAEVLAKAGKIVDKAAIADAWSKAEPAGKTG